LEGQSYLEDLHRYRPFIRIQTFIDYRKKNGGKLPPAIDKKRKAVIKDWFRLILWYSRLRKAAQGGSDSYIPHELLVVERRVQAERLKNGINSIKNAKLENYIK